MHVHARASTARFANATLRLAWRVIRIYALVRLLQEVAAPTSDDVVRALSRAKLHILVGAALLRIIETRLTAALVLASS